MRELWSVMKEEKNPILLYGMGDGADKIIQVCEDKGIKISGVFASDGFVRHQKFHDFTVISYSEAVEQYGSFVVLLSFATSIPEVMSRIISISKEQRLYIPDVPVIGNNLFDMKFYQSHKSEIETVRSLLHDSRSREIFDSVIEYKITGSIEPLLRSECANDDAWKNILNPGRYRFYADIGAFTGDTIEETMSYCSNIEKIYAMEPDPKTFSRMSKNVERFGIVEAYCAGAWSSEGLMSFSKGGSRSSRLGGGKNKVDVKVMPLDDIVRGGRVDYIKYDVEGAEYEALKGSEKTIRLNAPDLLVSLYHRSEDIFKLTLLVHDMLPYHKLYIRRFPYFPAWDLNLYAVR